MPSNFIPFVAVWGVLALAMVVMIFWRKAIAAHEDDSLHVSQASAAQQQVAVANKLEVIDKWGKILTIVVVVTGLVIAAVYFYQTWQASSSIGV